MRETTLWRHIDHPLSAFGKFQKVSDRFSGGVPDVLGTCRGRQLKGHPKEYGIPVAIELKELEGARVVKTKFRPGQLDWLRDWELGGGVSLILASLDQTVYGFEWSEGEGLERGMSPSSLRMNCLFGFSKRPRGVSWRDFVTLVLVPLIQTLARGPSGYHAD